MIQPKEIEVGGKQYMISKFDSIFGREVVAKYPASGLPKFGDYAINEEMMFKMMAFVCVITPAGNLPLTTKDLIRNHVPTWEELLKLEWELMKYNCSFFQNGRASIFLSAIEEKLPRWGSKMLMGLLDQLSLREKQPSTNSEPSTP